ncbi:MAG: 4Fe-4S dicluster domain-containing protein, partial [Saprospiraceae bacterium]|nr:4Fe-4S dicluster domain-containing protein [Saprospiraceae bacterium]
GKAKAMSWNDIDEAVGSQLTSGRRIRIVANTIISPAHKKAVSAFLAAYPNASLVMYDPISSAALLEANEQCFGEAIIPDYHFDKADVIVSFEADFLGTWISGEEYAHKYVANRKIKDVHNAKMSHHIQVESYMSLTGSNADNRILVKPSQVGAAIVALFNEVAGLTGNTKVNGPALSGEQVAKFRKIAQELVEHKGASLVVSGSNNVGEQILVNGINNMLDNYGATLDFTRASYQRQGRDQDVLDMIRQMNAGQVDAVFFLDDSNPAYDIPKAKQFVDAMAKVPLRIFMGGTPNETAVLCTHLAPTHHYLESWGDAEPKRGQYALIQPTIAPLFKTRQAEESLLRWSASDLLDANAEQPMYTFLQNCWEQSIFSKKSDFVTFRAFWDSALHDGVYDLPMEVVQTTPLNADFASAAGRVRKPSNSELEVSFYETVNVGSGQFAGNPWLMEMPDPVGRTTWGNFLAIPVKWEGGNSFTSYKDLNSRELYGEADFVEFTSNGVTERVPALRQFGQMEGTVALAVGYGRTVTGKMGKALADKMGANVYPMLGVDGNGNTQYYATDVNVSDKVGTEDEFACVQYHHTMGVTGIDPKSNEEINVDEKTIMTLGEGYQGGLTNRSIIYQANVRELEELKHHMDEKRAEAQKLNEHTLYPYEEYRDNIYEQGHHWGMHIDLNLCTGCAACQVACVAENNVPVVGKREVARHHEMTWLRIDRYYYGDYENPNVVYQPMMCQHCDNAPCENVCPVAATNHSGEGLNQMTYNRCIGTRYCANNCPYKVRRFNWLDYTTADLFPANEVNVSNEDLPFGADNLTRMVLNPDVTVRSRGVIEKCSFCVQRIQEGKLTAKREGRMLQDNDVKPACQTACSTGAIVFGDRNNKEGELAKRLENPLNYLVLEEVNVQSSVFYTAKVNNRDESLDA